VTNTTGGRGRSKAGKMIFHLRSLFGKLKRKMAYMYAFSFCVHSFWDFY
jgi:hypothetical protein